MHTKNLKRQLLAFSVGLLPLLSMADQIQIQFDVPALQVDPYHRPFVAVWLETPQRKAVQTLAVWYDKNDWLKDMRQWWRKLGRYDSEQYAAVTGATPKPGRHQVVWNSATSMPKVPAGEYYLLFEAAREAGGRDFVRQKIKLGHPALQHYELKGQFELGNITIDIKTTP